MNYELITVDELRAIDQIWDDELDISRRVLVDLYHEEMGAQLPWDSMKKPLFDEGTVDKLRRYAKESEVPMELINTMIFRTNKTKFFSNTRVMRVSLSRAVTQPWLQEDELVRYEEGQE